MTSDLDVYRTAAVLMREHGDDATIRAAMRADELMDQGDMDDRLDPADVAAKARKFTVLLECRGFVAVVEHPECHCAE